MQIFFDVREANLGAPSVLAIGNFDGVHLGHQALLRLVRSTAEELAAAGGGPHHSGLLTFDPHPLRVLQPQKPLSLLTTPPERLELAAGCGLDLGIIHPFSLETAQLSAAEFMQLLQRHLRMVCLVAGPDFALGRDRGGDLSALQALGRETGYGVVVMDPFDPGTHPVRSREVRAQLTRGAVAEAATLLGRPYPVTGSVVTGDGRGRTIGIPTANLQIPAHKLLPGDGVYATHTWIGREPAAGPFPSVTNIGFRPTVNGHHRTVEVHLLDFPPPTTGGGDLYGQTLTVEFLHRLRGEQKFATLAGLVDQIGQDIDRARGLLEAPAPPPAR